MGIRFIRSGLLYILLFADALRIGERLENESTIYNNLSIQTEDVIVNPRNPENPDSKTISYSARNFLGRRANVLCFGSKGSLKQVIVSCLQSGFRGFQRISEDVFGLSLKVICRVFPYIILSPMRNASAKD